MLATVATGFVYNITDTLGIKNIDSVICYNYKCHTLMAYWSNILWFWNAYINTKLYLNISTRISHCILHKYLKCALLRNRIQLDTNHQAINLS
jgi:hypothetical protein